MSFLFLDIEKLLQTDCDMNVWLECTHGLGLVVHHTNDDTFSVLVISDKEDSKYTGKLGV